MLNLKLTDAFFLALLTLGGCAVSSHSPKHSKLIFSEIIKKDGNSQKYCPEVAEGSICKMTWNEAVQFCKSQNAHLPLAREYAEMLKEQGIQILEVSEVKGTAPTGFYLVDCRNEDGLLDAFYMNHSGYQRLPGELENHLLWTASAPPQFPKYAHVYYDQWGGGGGDPQDHLLTKRNALQCVTTK